MPHLASLQRVSQAIRILWLLSYLSNYIVLHDRIVLVKLNEYTGPGNFIPIFEIFSAIFVYITLYSLLKKKLQTAWEMTETILVCLENSTNNWLIERRYKLPWKSWIASITRSLRLLRLYWITWITSHALHGDPAIRQESGSNERDESISSESSQFKYANPCPVTVLLVHAGAYTCVHAHVRSTT